METCILASSHRPNDSINSEMRDLLPTLQIRLGLIQESIIFSWNHAAYYQPSICRLVEHIEQHNVSPIGLMTQSVCK